MLVSIVYLSIDPSTPISRDKFSQFVSSHKKRVRERRRGREMERGRKGEGERERGGL
tara:strand:+ start:146 stop:316 length:171 start_codon:yes stop_codon:yes gene_type:complete